MYGNYTAMQTTGGRRTTIVVKRSNLEDVKKIIFLLCALQIVKGDMTSLREKLFSVVAEPVANQNNKVTIVGVGHVGMACAFNILSKHISGNIVLIAVNASKLRGEMLDLQHGSIFLKDARVNASTDYAATANSSLCIVTASAKHLGAKTRYDIAQRNIDIFREVIPQLVKYSPNTVLLIVSNPVDILTYAAWKFSGLPINRVIGSGTTLDTARFRYFLSEKLSVASTLCDGWIIGEHGDTSVPVWSGVSVAGVRLRDLDENVGTVNDTENYINIHKQVVNIGYEVMKLKGHSSWAIALSVSNIASAILQNTHQIYAVSTLVSGYHGIQKEVFLSLPCSLGKNGVIYVVQQTLTCEETCMLQKSTNTLYEAQHQLNF